MLLCLHACTRCVCDSVYYDPLAHQHLISVSRWAAEHLPYSQHHHEPAAASGAH